MFDRHLKKRHTLKQNSTPQKNRGPPHTRLHIFELFLINSCFYCKEVHITSELVLISFGLFLVIGTSLCERLACQEQEF